MMSFLIAELVPEQISLLLRVFLSRMELVIILKCKFDHVTPCEKFSPLPLFPSRDAFISVCFFSGWPLLTSSAPVFALLHLASYVPALLDTRLFIRGFLNSAELPADKFSLANNQATR